jgi:HipA-like protein
VLVETDAGVFYTKLRGAAQAPKSLVAEIIVGALADALGLSVPPRVLIDMPHDIPIDDPHQELAQLLRQSAGRNLGFHLLTNVREFTSLDVSRVDADMASKTVWLDGLVQNPDRTVTNPNLLWSEGRPWLIDHGASLGFQHDWQRVTEDSPRASGWDVQRHVLYARAVRLAHLDEGLSALLPRKVLESAVEQVPDDFLTEASREARVRRRAAYVAFLWKRLRAPRPYLFPLTFAL